MNESNAYILGTERAELFRLGIQHQVWSSEARKCWEIAGFTAQQTILDLGCGPGFCTTELAYIVGEKGIVHAVDLSENYIRFLKEWAGKQGLNIKTQCCYFDDMQFDDESLDGVYDRWALAWLPNPEKIIQKLHRALKSGGRIAIHEYYDWSTFQTEPSLPNLSKGIAAALQSFKESPGDINIGKRIPRIFEKQGFKVISIRPMTKLAQAKNLEWQWPKTFLEIYVPKLVEKGLIDQITVDSAIEELQALEQIPSASILCPHMVEVIAEKK